MDVKQLTGILFLDIETVSQVAGFDQLSPRMQALWATKSRTLSSEDDPAESYAQKAAIYAEFGRIICIGLGQFTHRAGDLRFRTKVLYGHSEDQILRDFLRFLEQSGPNRFSRLCAHNGREFDFPYLCRRLLVHGLPVPDTLQLMGKKPWENAHLLDTMELWKCGDRKAYTSLDLLSACFGIPGSKDDLTGKEVGRVYHQENGLKRIAQYCQKDVAVMARVFLRLQGMPDLEPGKVLLQG
jgi:3'-5' exonuclease